MHPLLYVNEPHKDVEQVLGTRQWLTSQSHADTNTATYMLWFGHVTCTQWIAQLLFHTLSTPWLECMSSLKRHGRTPRYVELD